MEAPPDEPAWQPLICAIGENHLQALCLARAIASTLTGRFGCRARWPDGRQRPTKGPMCRQSRAVYVQLPSFSGRVRGLDQLAVRYRPTGCQSPQHWDWADDPQLPARLVESGRKDAVEGSTAATSENGSTQFAKEDSPRGAFATVTRSSTRRKQRSADFEDQAPKKRKRSKMGSICFHSASVRSEGYREVIALGWSCERIGLIRKTLTGAFLLDISGSQQSAKQLLTTRNSGREAEVGVHYLLPT